MQFIEEHTFFNQKSPIHSVKTLHGGAKQTQGYWTILTKSALGWFRENFITLYSFLQIRIKCCRMNIRSAPTYLKPTQSHPIKRRNIGRCMGDMRREYRNVLNQGHINILSTSDNVFFIPAWLAVFQNFKDGLLHLLKQYAVFSYYYNFWGLPHFVRPVTTCKAGLIQLKLGRYI